MKNKLTYFFAIFIIFCLFSLEAFAASKVTAATVGTQNGQVLAGTPGSVTYTVTVSVNNSSGGTSTVSLSGTALPTGAIASFSSGTYIVSGSIVSLGSGPSGTIILTISNDGTTPAGTTTGITLNFTSSPDVTSSAFSYLVESNVPVELTSFSASVLDNNVNLKWNTATEVNNYGFEIQRSVKTDNWEVLGFVEGHGNSNSPKVYSFTDSKIMAAGKYFYRLKQVDNDGSFEYSNIIEIDFDSPFSIELSQNYPNPFNPSTTISFTLPESGNVSLRIFNAIGEEVAELVNGFVESGVHAYNFNAENLPSGMYIYRLRTFENSMVKKMLFLK